MKQYILNITCVFILASVIWHANRIFSTQHLNINCGLSGCTVFFYITSQTARRLKKSKQDKSKTCVFIFSTTDIRNTVRIIPRDIIINVPGLPANCPLFLSDFIETSIFSIDFRQTELSNFVKICSAGYFLPKRI
jgi:hypothetical protein